MKALLNLIVLGAAVLMLVAATGAQAGTCGVGNRIWAGNDGIGAKLLASTTNFWTLKAISTTFGIAGCEQGEPLFGLRFDEKVLHFASNNLDRLARDIARGSGEHLSALAKLIEVSDRDLPAFQDLTQRNFATLFPHDDVTVGEVLFNLDRLIGNDQKLSVYVSS
jgi:hypothetical protein